eukprot:1596434-Rhodomonas_salina.3
MMGSSSVRAASGTGEVPPLRENKSFCAKYLDLVEGHATNIHVSNRQYNVANLGSSATSVPVMALISVPNSSKQVRRSIVRLLHPGTGHRIASAYTPNQIQENASSVQFVPGMWLPVFDFGV